MTATEAITQVRAHIGGAKMVRGNTEKLTFPKLPANKLLKSYLEYKCSKKIPLPPLQWDTPPISHKLNYFEVKTRLEVLILETNTMKKTIPKSSEHFKKRWEQLQMMAKDFKLFIDKCDDFVANNEEKRKRFKQKMTQSRLATIQKAKDVESLQKRMIFVKEIKGKMEEKIKEYEMYPNFLAAVAKQNTLQFKNANEVLERFEALYIARHTIGKAEQRYEKILEERREKLQKILDVQLAKQNELIVLLGSITRRYDQARKTTTHAENLIAKINEEDHLKKQESFLVKCSCWQVYHHMRKRKFTSVEVQQEDFIGQLKEINKVLGIFRMVFTKLNIPFNISH